MLKIIFFLNKFGFSKLMTSTSINTSLTVFITHNSLDIKNWFIEFHFFKWITSSLIVDVVGNTWNDFVQNRKCEIFLIIVYKSVYIYIYICCSPTSDPGPS